MSENVLFEHNFLVQNVNKGNYERVARIEAYSNTDSKEVKLLLDVNIELWEVNEGDQIILSLALSLNLDGSKDDGKGWRDIGRGDTTMADEYDYVCYGRIYRFEEGEGSSDNM
jgi:DNA-directed RNA polymerases I, II, and III subunit RPABC3